MTVLPSQAANAAATKSAATPAPANPKGDMGRDTFMKLLVAELKQQDPNEPMQAREMVTQLAQLSSVEKLTGIDTMLQKLQTQGASNASMQSAGLVGRKVTANTNHLTLDGLHAPQGRYQLQAAAEKIEVAVRDAAGKVVQMLELAAQKAGGHTFQWDGQTSDGTRAPVGSYTFDIKAKNAKGVLVPASTEVSGLVTEVTYDSGAPQVVVAGAHVPLGDVTSIAQ